MIVENWFLENVPIDLDSMPFLDGSMYRHETCTARKIFSSRFRNFCVFINKLDLSSYLMFLQDQNCFNDSFHWSEPAMNLTVIKII